MAQRALVLGGGGIVGIAWEVGVIAGLAERGVQLARAEDVIGTSAGSLVGAWLAGGRDFAAHRRRAGRAAWRGAAAAAALRPTRPRSPVSSAPGWASRASDPSRRASSARSRSRRRRRPRSARSPGSRESWRTSDWPARLRVTAVDAESGELRVFDAKSGVALERGVAASCCVPGIFAPVSIEGRRYVDGGVLSGTHADLALEQRRTARAGAGSLRARQRRARPLDVQRLDAEMAALRDAGRRGRAADALARGRARARPRLHGPEEARRRRAPGPRDGPARGGAPGSRCLAGCDPRNERSASKRARAASRSSGSNSSSPTICPPRSEASRSMTDSNAPPSASVPNMRDDQEIAVLFRGDGVERAR